MEKPDATTIAWYEEAVPSDPRAVRSQMFGFPCAFVGGHMFFGTFSRSVVARVGEARVTPLIAEGKGTFFEPMEGRAWKEYIQVPTGSLSDRELAGIAQEALTFAAALPPKPPKAPKAPKAKKGAG